MKKVFAYFFAIQLFLSIGYSNSDNSINFPSLQILKVDSATFITNQDLKNNYNTVFINFSPTCEHCQRTIQSILNNYNRFKETQFILTSFEEFATIRQFYFDYNLGAYKNIYIGQEIDYSLTKQIKYSSFPCLVLFNKQQQYVKTIDEETNAKTLLKQLNLTKK